MVAYEYSKTLAKFPCKSQKTTWGIPENYYFWEPNRSVNVLTSVRNVMRAIAPSYSPVKPVNAPPFALK